MITQNISDLSKGETKFYPINFQFLNELSKHLSLCFESFGNAWCQISASEVEKILMSAVKLYHYRTNANKIIAAGRRVPNEYLLNALSHELVVPRFLRDVARELSRPMYLGDCLYLPDLTFDGFPEQGTKISKLFADIDDLAMMRWIHVLHKAKLEIVEILPECIRPAPLSFYVHHTNQVYSVSQLDDWRIDAVSQLRHLVWENPIDVQEPKIQIAPLELYQSTLRERFAGPIACFVYSVLCLHQYSSLTALSRFPTEQTHSSSPPRSKHVTESIRAYKPEKRRKKRFTELEVHEEMKDINKIK